MLNLIGANGKKTLKEVEAIKLDAISGDSVARLTGSVPQFLSRIRSVDYVKGFFIFKMKPDKYDLRDTKIMPAGDVLKKVKAMHRSVRKMPLEDPKMWADMLVELERKLVEAMEKDESALKDIMRAQAQLGAARLAQQKEDSANGIIRFPGSVN